MRIKFKTSKVFTLIVVLINLFLFFITWKYFLATDDSFEKISSSTNAHQENEKMATIKPIKIDRVQEAKKFLQHSLTIIFRDFYHFDNDLKSSIDHLLALIPDLRILIISEEYPYPPINIFASHQPTINQTTKPSTLIYKDNVQFHWLSMDITKSASELNPLNYIQTKYVLFMPDNFKLANARQMFQRMIKSLDNSRSFVRKKILIVPFSSNQRSINYCFQINSDIPNWTLEYEVKNYTNKNCDLYTQKHAILLESAILNDFLEPFASPFPEYFYLQAKFANCQLQYSNESFQEGGKKLMTSYHSRSKRKSIKKDQFRELYRKLQIKKVVKKFHFVPEQKHLKSAKKNREKGNRLNDADKMNAKGNSIIKIGKEGKDSNIDVLIEQLEIPASFFINQSAQIQMKSDTHYFGCEKNTKSCIGQVYNEKPFYHYLNRHTPPCCLEKLKSIFHYIVEELENTGIRYWLDNLVLRDAIEIKDLSHDAYEIDISFNVNDYNRSTSLKRCFDSRPFTDLSGFYWIKATDGHYLKVQYSKTNEIHINLLPFEIQGDRMVPKGFYGSKAKFFSIEFLHPMSTVYFLGRNVFTPNNIPNYLAMKGLL